MNSYSKSFLLIGFFLMALVSVGQIAANEDLPATDISSHMEAPISSGRNVVYCATFQIAWNQLKDDILKEGIKVQAPVAMVAFLNKSLAVEADMDEKDYLALAGFVKGDIVGRINRGLQRQFGYDAWLLNPDEYQDPATILVYTFLNKNLRFKYPFEGFKSPIHFGAGNSRAAVAGFGIHHYLSRPEHVQMGEQVEILDYKDNQNFIVRLKEESPDDEIVLAKVSPEATLLKTYQKVQSKIANSQSMRLEKDDILHIPKFDIALLHSYSPLLGIHLANKGFEEYFFDEAVQRINFKLDESGAKVKSEGKIALKKGGPIDFKLLLFDSPFLLYLKQQNGRYPYLMLWIENPELLVKSQ